MANVLQPFGFEQWGSASGPVNFAQNHNPPYRIAGGSSPYTMQIFRGDAVRMNASLTGYIERWTAADGDSTHILAGIFDGCEYYSISQAKNIWVPYWPGSTDASGDVSAYVIDDPNALFKVQSGGTGAAITQTAIGQTADISATPLGNTTTGISGMSLATPTTTATFPFKVVNVITSPPGTNGTDLTSPYNYVVVAFNYQTYKSLVGI